MSDRVPVPKYFKKTNNYKRLMFTVNLIDGKSWEDFEQSWPLLRIELNPSFFVAGRETAPDTGRKHFQGYMEFPKEIKGARIKKCFRNRFPKGTEEHPGYSIWFGAPNASAQKNIEYCTKVDKDPWIYGEPRGKQQGRRTDLEEVMATIRGGATMQEVADNHSRLWVQYRRSFNEYANMCSKARNWPTQLIFIWGPTGTGKTMHAQELDPTPVFWESNQFLNGYHGEDVILLDDFDYKKMSWQTFLVMTDRYKHTVNIKGGSMNFAPKTIIFTSNSDPKSWYPDAPEETRKAIHRRMDEFGETICLETFKPKEETLLDKFLRKGAETTAAIANSTSAATCAPNVAPAATAASPGRVREPESIPESEEEEEFCTPGNIKRTHSIWAGIEGEGRTESSEDEEEEDSDVEWDDSASVHSNDRRRFKRTRK